jgi:RimJ/RimL family protein N-acetyltransferase
MKEQPTLATERLVLRPFEAADAADIQRLAGDFAIADTTLTMPHPYEDGMAEEWMATHRPRFEAGEAVHFAVVLRETGRLIGAMGLEIHKRFRRAELGYWIGKPYWNQGYATEAAHAVVAYAFTNLDLHRVHARHFARNPASGRVMQKVGMVHEGRAREHVLRWDVYEDLELYGILREE